VQAPKRDRDLWYWAMGFEQAHGRRPRVSELSRDHRVRLGDRVFAYARYRDAHHPLLSDAGVYTGCLQDHGVERDRPDGCDRTGAHMPGPGVLR
jgi:hypothetical protein